MHKLFIVKRKISANRRIRVLFALLLTFYSWKPYPYIYIYTWFFSLSSSSAVLVVEFIAFIVTVCCMSSFRDQLFLSRFNYRARECDSYHIILELFHFSTLEGIQLAYWGRGGCPEVRSKDQTRLNVMGHDMSGSGFSLLGPEHDCGFRTWADCPLTCPSFGKLIGRG